MQASKVSEQETAPGRPQRGWWACAVGWVACRGCARLAELAELTKL
jgi:hypothetical protein